MEEKADSKLVLEFIVNADKIAEKITNKVGSDFKTATTKISSDTVSFNLVKINGEREHLGQLASCRDSILDEVKQDARLVTDQCSWSYGVELYPLLQDFETSFRKLLYLGLTYYDAGELKDESRKSFEEMDLGTLYEAVFDELKLSGLAIKIANNSKGNEDLKARLRELLDKDVTPLWNKYFSSTIAPTLTSEKGFIRALRNNVMHFKRIKHDEFTRGKETLSRTIGELEKAIKDFTTKPQKRETMIKPGLSQAFFEAIKAQTVVLSELSSVITEDVLTAGKAIHDEVSSIYDTCRPIIESLRSTTDLLTSIKMEPLPPSVTATLFQVEKLQQSPGYKAALESAEKVHKLGEKYEPFLITDDSNRT